MHFIFVSDKFGTVVNFNLIYIHRSVYFFFFFLLLFCPCHYFLFSFYFRIFLFHFCFANWLRIGRRCFSHNIFLTIFLHIFFHSFWVVDYFCWLCFDLIFAQLLFGFFSCVFTFLLFLVFYIITCVYERYILFTFK